MRRLLLAVTVVSAVAVSPAEAKTTLPSLFSRQVHAINAAPHAPAVLLPRSMPLDAKHLFASGAPSGFSYDLEIGAVRNCGGADACFVADFTAARAHTVFGKRVKVKGASKAGFVALSCGGSCSPPQIDFLVGGIRYVIQANLNSHGGDRKALIAAAESAIAAGPR
jgi:hypothetical protein